MNAEMLKERIRQQGCWVFGTGFIASMFKDALETRGLQSYVKGYLVSRPVDQQVFDGHAVRASDDASIARGDLVCVAVHESLYDEVAAMLTEQGYDHVMWVYPYLYDLLYGEPLYKGVSMPLERILAAQNPAWYWLAVRSLAMRHVLSHNDADKHSGASKRDDADKLEDAARNDAGMRDDASKRDDADAALVRDAYVTAQTLHCSRETAERRYAKLRELCSSMAGSGFDASRPVLMDTNLQIIDGLHRIAAAWVLGMPSVPCDLVRPNEAFDRLLTDRNKMTLGQLERAGLSEEQLALVRREQERMIGAARRTAPEITFIIPAYNVADYIDQCLESVVSQTFADFEVLLINDGSADETAAHCDSWAQRDARIHAIHKPNSGVSPSRNLGIELALGRYLAFVDPDDWLDERYLELLHDAAEREGADFAECDIWRYDNRTGKKIHRSCGQRMGVRYTLEEHMKYGPTASYKAISKRSLWMDNGVRFPDISFESPAIFALVIALAGDKSAYVPQPLYYYRRFRENSLVETAYAKTPGKADNTLGVDAMAHLCREFRERGLNERYEREMPGLVAYRLNDILAMQYHRRSAEDFAELVANQRAFLEAEFPQLPQGAYITWGGYNLNKIMQHLPMLNDPSCRFNFSSIAAIAFEGDAAQGIARHANRYREMMLQREIDQVFWDVAAQQQPRFIFIDLIDDRFDLIECAGRYLTASDAFEGATFEGAMSEGIDLGRRIPFGSDEHLGLWEQAFGRFVRRVREISARTQLVLVENYLSERVGTLAGTREFEHAAAIRETNRTLAKMYEHVRSACDDIVCIPAYECADYFTDEAYEYGAVPQHLNDIVNQRIAKMIEDIVL